MLKYNWTQCIRWMQSSRIVRRSRRMKALDRCRCSGEVRVTSLRSDSHGLPAPGILHLLSSGGIRAPLVEPTVFCRDFGRSPILFSSQPVASRLGCERRGEARLGSRPTSLDDRLCTAGRFIVGLPFVVLRRSRCEERANPPKQMCWMSYSSDVTLLMGWETERSNGGRSKRRSQP